MKHQQGFTLIETIIYLALFTIIIGGGVVAAYQIVEGGNASYNHIVLQEEANFLIRKIQWAATQSGITIFMSGDDIMLQRNAGTPTILNCSSVRVSHFTSTVIPAANGKPPGTAVSFKLTTAQNSRPAIQTFSFTKYLRK